MTKSGIFITFEGGEGCGKTTQIKRLAESLKCLLPDNSLLITREPGGTSSAELIRDLLVNGDVDKWRPTTEALMMSAARHEHVEEIIRPALKDNKIVISDRFSDSTYVYQGIISGVAQANIKILNKIVCGSIQPDLTIIFDLSSQAGLARAKSREIGENRFEAKGLAFHERVRSGFIELAKENPKRCILINADRSPGQIADEVLVVVMSRLRLDNMAKNV